MFDFVSLMIVILDFLIICLIFFPLIFPFVFALILAFLSNQSFHDPLEKMYRREQKLIEKIENNRDNKEIIIDILKERGCLITHVSEEFKNEPDVVLAAVENFDDTLIYTSKELKENFSFAVEAVKKNMWCLVYMNESFKNNLELISIGLKKSHRILFWDIIGDEASRFLKKYKSERRGWLFPATASEYRKVNEILKYLAVFIGNKMNFNLGFGDLTFHYNKY